MQNKEIKKIESARRQRSPLLYIVVTVGIVVALAVGAVLWQRSFSEVNHVHAQLGGLSYRLEVVDTEAGREKGLSERDVLPQGEGMLFVFPTDDDWAIWMLQMRFPIDIVWLNANKAVVGIKENATPGSYPEAFRADAQSRYVVELNAGDVAKLGLKKGDILTWQP